MKKVLNFTIILILCISLFLIMENYQLIKNTALFSYRIFLTNVFPSLFIFMVITSLLINYGFVDIMSKICGNMFSKVFKIDKNATFIFFMSLFTGSPSNAKYIKELLDNKMIDEITGTKILMFTHFPNPLFIISMVSILSINLAYIILFCTYISNIIIGLLFRNCFISFNKNNIKKIKQENFGTCFSKAIISSINTLLLIFGIIFFFLIVSSLLKAKFNLSNYYHALISGILEMTQGIKYVSLLDIKIKTKALLMTIFLSFGGLSIHTQVMSIISDTKIKYQPFLIARLLHASISTLLVYLLI